MKLKIILSVLLLFSLLKVDANPLVDISIASGKEEVFLHSNDIPFEILTTGKEDGSRSVIPLVPFVVFVEDSIIRKSKFPQNPKRSVRFSGKRTKRSVQKRKARNTQKAETKVL